MVKSSKLPALRHGPKRKCRPEKAEAKESKALADYRKNRFVRGSFTAAVKGLGITHEEMVFGREMQKFLAVKRRSFWLNGEPLDVMMNLGYKNRVRNFKRNVDDFIKAIDRLRKRRRFPTWSQVLRVAKQECGWYLRAERRPLPCGFLVPD